MAYLINPEDLELVESAREFCENEIKEQCKEYDISGEWPAELYEKAAELGYTSLEVPEEYGGPGLDKLTVAAINEEFAKADAGFATTIAASHLALTPVLLAGTEEQKQQCCDLVLDGLLGLKMEKGQLTADPLIPDEWDYFCVAHLTQDNWTVVFDRTGNRYGRGKGLMIFKA